MTPHYISFLTLPTTVCLGHSRELKYLVAGDSDNMSVSTTQPSVQTGLDDDDFDDDELDGTSYLRLTTIDTTTPSRCSFSIYYKSEDNTTSTTSSTSKLRCS